MRLHEFACSSKKISPLTKAGIKPKEERVDPDGAYSPLGTNNEKPIPLTANAAVKVDNAVKLAKLKKSK